jgi:hypothetical protein
MIGGAIAACASTVCTYPLDLARSRMAVIPVANDGANKTFALFRYIRIWYTVGGVAELYRYLCRCMSVCINSSTEHRGVIPTVIGVAPYGAIAFSVNDYLKDIVIIMQSLIISVIDMRFQTVITCIKRRAADVA